jgi:hypothetical protein
MGISAGPFLKFCGSTADTWDVSILVVTDQDSQPDVQIQPPTPSATLTQPQKIHAVRNSFFWTCRVSTPRGTQDLPVACSIKVAGNSQTAAWVVPPTNAAPRIAYASCAGFHSARDAQRYGNRRHERWQHLVDNHRRLLQTTSLARNEEGPAHLLLMGGDQVYADAIWSDRREASAFVDWSEAGQNEKTPFGPLMARQADNFFLNLYLRRWKEPEPAAAFAAIPTLMMWDDHDIFDGWGSFPPKRHQCPVYQGIFQTAAKYFRLFQQHSSSINEIPGLLQPPADGQQPHSFGFNLGKLAILAPDLRGCRTNTQILGRKNLDAIVAWINRLGKAPEPPRHLLVMLSLPLMYPSFALLETGLQWVPGAQDLEDDVRDHWTSAPHKEERLRLIHRLLAFSASSGCQVTIVSGDVHVGAVSTITGTAAHDKPAPVIQQLISSALVNAPPPASAVFFLNQFTQHTERIDDGILGEMRTFSNSSQTFIPRRNWLSLEPDSVDRIWAKLHVEGDPHPLVRVIQPRSR